MNSAIYFHTEANTLTSWNCHLYKMAGGYVYRWIPTYKVGGKYVRQHWALSAHNEKSFQAVVDSGVVVPATRWQKAIYGMPVGSTVTVPDCYSLRALVAKYPPRTHVVFKEVNDD